MKIGSYALDAPWLLAPMAGVSNQPFRMIVREMGAAAAPTELVSAKGLVYRQGRSEAYLAHDASERPFWVQLFGGEPEIMGEAAVRAAELGAQIVDVNMGCPVKKVLRTGGGAALHCDVPRAARMVAEIARRTRLPVTAKIRAGWDAGSRNAVELARALADVGCAAIAVHARTRAQGYSGKADWRAIAEVVAAVSVPVIGNGDVRSGADGHRMMRETGCAGVMVGRGALGNPWIFRELVSGTAVTPAPAERWRVIERHLRDEIALLASERRGILQFRPQLLWYSQGMPQGAMFRRAATRIDALAELVSLCESFFLNGNVPAGSSAMQRSESAETAGASPRTR